MAPSVQRDRVWLTPTTRVRCSNAAKTRNPLKFARCPKLPDRSQPLVGLSSPYCGDIWRRYCCLTSFFLIVDTCLSCGDIAWQNCTMVRRWWLFGDFLRPVISARRLQRISDLHPKCALRPHHVWKYGRHPVCESYLKILEPLANQALRICLGAFSTSPVSSLQVLAHEPPLNLRREQLSLQYCMKLKSTKLNPTHKKFFNHKPLYIVINLMLFPP